MKKYEFTGKTMIHEGHTLRQIKALHDFGDIKAGDLGGWIESNYNLSQDGNCWIDCESKVFGNARVDNNLQIFGGAEIRKADDIVTVEPLEKGGDMITIFRRTDKECSVNYGSFCGSVDEFCDSVGCKSVCKLLVKLMLMWIGANVKNIFGKPMLT